MKNDTRNLVTGTITWYEDETSGRGYLRLKFGDGGIEEVQCDDPITPSTDSHDVASQFNGYEWQSIEHDGTYIHVTVLA